MCRLFGLSGAPQRIRATFWLLDARDSLAAQSRREPDGVGLGVFDERGRPFIAHIRYATTGGLTSDNTHPFEQDGRLFAHNGVVEGLDRLDAELGPSRDLVHGDTDSERIFALITARTRQSGDLGDSIVDAVGWIAAHLPVFAVNLVLTTPTELWALRYPDVHPLYLLRRGATGRHLDHASTTGTVRVHSGDLAATPSVVVATERMDADPGWRPLRPGELVHVDPDLTVTTRIALPDPPAHQLSLADLHPHAAAAQR